MKILITGATGFLGTELTRYFMQQTNNNVVIYARNEVKLADAYDNPRITKVLGDIRDYDNLYFACRDNDVDVIIHAAALKRIDICQDHPMEANKTNIDGTINCINVCKHLGTKLCFISTDKACEPCTTYGSTKYLAEQLVRRESQKGYFMGMVVRYGNVLNSTGSVLKIWEKQIKKRGKVQVRDINMTRFFWTVEDSVVFIDKAINKENIKAGEVLIPKIKSLNIHDMAVYLYGREKIIVTSCSHTEKTHESLSGDYCSKDHVVHPKELLCPK